MLLLIRIKLVVIDTSKCHFYYVENSSIQQLIEVHIFSSLVSYDWRRFLKSKLIAFFMLSIILIILLHSIVGQVYKRLVDTLLAERELMAACSYVALFEQVALLILKVATVYQDPKSYIKLSLVYEQWLLDILLNHKHIWCHSSGEKVLSPFLLVVLYLWLDDLLLQNCVITSFT